MLVGILGCGAIGGFVARRLKKQDGVKLGGLLDVDRKRAEKIAKRCGAKAFLKVEEMAKRCDVVLEAASADAVRMHGETVLRHSHLIIMSSGALMDRKLLAKFKKTAKQSGKTIIVPSGAIAGLDGITAAGKASRATLTSIKNPESLGVKAVRKRTLFRGKAGEAAGKFPKNINVAASASIALGKEIDVEIVADPGAKSNTHILTVWGSFGRLTVKTENAPLRENPKTSGLAAMSALAAVRRMEEVVRIGN